MVVRRTSAQKNRKKPTIHRYDLYQLFKGQTLLQLLHDVGKLIDELGEDAVVDYRVWTGYYESPEAEITITESVDRAAKRE